MPAVFLPLSFGTPLVEGLGNVEKAHHAKTWLHDLTINVRSKMSLLDGERGQLEAAHEYLEFLADSLH